MVNRGLLTVVALLLLATCQVAAQEKTKPVLQGQALPSDIQQLSRSKTSGRGHPGSVSLLGWSVSLFENRAHIGAHEADSSGGLKGLSYVVDYDGENWYQGDPLTTDEEWRRQGHANSLDTLNLHSFWGYPFDILSSGGIVHVHLLEYNHVEISQDLHASDRMAGDHFGWSVSLSGDRAFVGAPDSRIAIHSILTS